MRAIFTFCYMVYERLERASPPQWRIGHALDSAVRPNKLRNVCRAGIGPSLGTSIMPYVGLRNSPCENQTYNPGKDAIFPMVLTP